MNKTRKFMFGLTIAFAVLTFFGLVMTIFSQKSVTESLFDCIALLISAASIGIAMSAQMTADKELRRTARMVKELNEINKTTENDLKADEGLRKKIDKILSLEEEIYHRVGGRKDVKKVEKAKRND